MRIWKTLVWGSLLVLLVVPLVVAAQEAGAGNAPSLEAGLYLQEPATPTLELPPPATGSDGQPVVRFLLFHSPTCPHCQEIIEDYLPTIDKAYGQRVEYRLIDVSVGDQYMTLLALEQKLGLPEDRQGLIPALVIGNQALIGAAEIPARLGGLIDQYLAQGGLDFPSLENLPTVVLPTPAPQVEALLFYSPQDSGWEGLRSYLSGLIAQYNEQLVLAAGSLDEPINVQLVEALHRVLGVPQGSPGEPVLLIDHELLVGEQAIRSQLPGLVERYLLEGGKPLPDLEALVSSEMGTAEPGTPAVDTPEPVATPKAKPAIYVAYFDKAGCQECARTTYDLKLVQSQYPQVEVETFLIEENQPLNEWLCERYGVPEEQRLSTPMLFIGEDVLIGSEATASQILQAVADYVGDGAPRIWAEFDESEGEQGLLERFRSFGVLTVAGAGLIDGLNPCAFATLVFFISYLSFTGRRGRDILLVGVAFALGVFLTYLLVGVGLLKAIQSLAFFSSLGRWVYLVTALLCVVLAAFTFRDYVVAREGKVTEMTLKLPMRLRRQINKVIREGAQMRAFVGVAFVTGFLVSLIELACTGQVYLPTIMFVLSVPDLAAKAFAYLFLYCLLFILPLIVVFVLAYLGTTSEQLGQVVNRHTSTVKLATGLVFLGLSLWMTWTLAPLFGIESPWKWVVLAAVPLMIAAAAWLLERGRRAQPDERPGSTGQRRRQGRGSRA